MTLIAPVAIPAPSLTAVAAKLSSIVMINTRRIYANRGIGDKISIICPVELLHEQDYTCITGSRKLLRLWDDVEDHRIPVAIHFFHARISVCFAKIKAV